MKKSPSSPWTFHLFPRRLCIAGRGSCGAFYVQESPRVPRQIVVLVKPQFEAGRELVGKGGIVRDAAVQQSAVKKVESSLVELGASNLEKH